MASRPGRQWQGRRNDDDEDEEEESSQSQTVSSNYTGGGDSRKGSAGPLPVYDGSREPGVFEEFRVRARLWLFTTNLENKARGPRLLQALSGKAFESVKHLIDDEQWLASPDNGEKLIALLAKPEYYGKEELESLYHAMHKLFYSELRKPDDDLPAFRSRFEQAVRKIQKSLPPEALGFLFLKQSKISGESLERLITLTGGDLKFDSVVEALRKLKMRLLDGEESTKQRHVWVQESVDEREDTVQDDLPHGQDEEDLDMIEHALAELDGDESLGEVTEDGAREILMTLIKNKVSKPQIMSYKQVQQQKREIKNSRGFRPVGLQESVERLSPHVWHYYQYVLAVDQEVLNTLKPKQRQALQRPNRVRQFRLSLVPMDEMAENRGNKRACTSHPDVTPKYVSTWHRLANKLKIQCHVEMMLKVLISLSMPLMSILKSVLAMMMRVAEIEEVDVFRDLVENMIHEKRAMETGRSSRKSQRSQKANSVTSFELITEPTEASWKGSRKSHHATKEQRDPGAASSSQTTGYPIPHRRTCYCGMEPVLLTCRKEGLNFMRRFYRCPKEPNSGKQCDFFQWIEMTKAEEYEKLYAQSASTERSKKSKSTKKPSETSSESESSSSDGRDVELKSAPKKSTRSGSKKSTTASIPECDHHWNRQGTNPHQSMRTCHKCGLQEKTRYRDGKFTQQWVDVSKLKKPGRPRAVSP
eukprot:s1406_g5.t1